MAPALVVHLALLTARELQGHPYKLSVKRTSERVSSGRSWRLTVHRLQIILSQNIPYICARILCCRDPIHMTATFSSSKADASLNTQICCRQQSADFFKGLCCAAPTALVSKTDAVGMYPLSQSNFTVSPPLKYKIITYTVSGVNSVATLTCAFFPPPCACLWVLL